MANRVYSGDVNVRHSGIPTVAKVSVGILAAIAFTFVGFFIAGAVDFTPEAEKPQQLEVTLSGKTEAEDQADAAAALVSILRSSPSVKSESEMNALLKKLDFESGLSSIPKTMSDEIIFAPQASAKFKTEAYQSLISLRAILTGFDSNQVNPPPSASSVYIDQTTGRAFIPIALLGGDPAPVSLEMVYSDGRWKLDPYSFVASVKLSAAIGPAQE